MRGWIPMKLKQDWTNENALNCVVWIHYLKRFVKLGPHDLHIDAIEV